MKKRMIVRYHPSPRAHQALTLLDPLENTRWIQAECLYRYLRDWLADSRWRKQCAAMKLRVSSGE